MSEVSADILEARRVIQIEADSLRLVAERLDSRFVSAVELLLNCRGKVIVTGIGKSGHIGRKFASTLSSTGTPAVFLHPAESSHGDLGLISGADVLVAMSFGGESPELVPILLHIARRGVPLIALTGKSESTLARAAQVVLEIAITEEACPLGLAPTSSSTATLALCDALAMAVLKRRGFRREDFAEFHPGGSLGRKLTTRVKDVMHSGDSLPLVNPEAPLSQVVAMMTAKEVRGVTGVVDARGALVGVITDGDIRRRLEKNQGPMTERAAEVMSRTPKTIDHNELAEKALFLMQEFRIQLLFAVDRSSAEPLRPVGLLHLQDLLRAGLR